MVIANFYDFSQFWSILCSTTTFDSYRGCL